MNIPRRGGLRERIYREEWNLGIVDQPAVDIVRHGLVMPIRWLPKQPPWYGLADPGYCCGVLFAERLNWLTGRGEIWSADWNDDTLTFKPWARSTAHLSYPMPFLDDDRLYLTMETAETGSLYIWRYQDGTWLPRKIMDRPAIDPTFWYDVQASCWWLFCTFANDQPDTRLHLFFADDLEGLWTPHPNNPVKTDLASARSAGPLFYSDGQLIRPSQDSRVTYGHAIVLNAITRLDRNDFQERSVRRLEPDGEYPHGLHTFCPIGDKTIVDGKRWGFNALDTLRYPMTGILNRYRRRTGRTAEICFLDRSLLAVADFRYRKPNE